MIYFHQYIFLYRFCLVCVIGNIYLSSSSITKIIYIFFSIFTSLLYTLFFPIDIMIRVHLDVDWVWSTDFNFVQAVGLG